MKGREGSEYEQQQSSRQASQPTDCMNCATTSFRLKMCSKQIKRGRDQVSQGRGKGCGVGLNENGLGF